MANGFLIVDEKDWKELTPERRDWLIFNTLKSMDCRLQKLEKRPLTDKCWSFAGGVIGGFLAAIGFNWGAK